MKKTFLFSTILLLLAGMSLRAQTWEWAKKLEGTSAGTDNVVVKSVDTDIYGNTYVTGYYSGELNGSASLGSTQQDGFVAKYSVMGGLIWIHKFGGPGGDAGNAISVETATNSPCFFITGFVQYNDPNTVTFTSGTVSINLPSVTACLATAPPNNIYLRGGLSPKQPFVAKYDTSGKVLWVRPVYAPGCLDAEGLGISASYRHVVGNN